MLMLCVHTHYYSKYILHTYYIVVYHEVHTVPGYRVAAVSVLKFDIYFTNVCVQDPRYKYKMF